MYSFFHSESLLTIPLLSNYGDVYHRLLGSPTFEHRLLYELKKTGATLIFISFTHKQQPNNSNYAFLALSREGHPLRCWLVFTS